MSPYYYNELPTTVMDEEVMVILGILLVFLGIVLLCGLVGWILSSMSLHSIAKRRGIRHAWLAWIPIGCYWVLGSVSDQYQHLVQGKITSRRKILMVLYLLAGMIGLTSQIMSFMEVEIATTVGTIAAFAFLIFTVGISICTLVFYHICNYDLYRSCNPQNAVVFLVLGIIFSVCQPFFYLACRKKDLGMVVPQPVTPEPAELPLAGPEF